MPIIINELHTDLTEPAAPDAADQGAAGAASEPAALQPDLALQRAAALLAERRARLEDD
jgi:hypothetical protein